MAWTNYAKRLWTGMIFMIFVLKSMFFKSSTFSKCLLTMTKLNFANFYENLLLLKNIDFTLFRKVTVIQKQSILHLKALIYDFQILEG